ncbi:inverse autotransporter beta domain-containing protein [Thorsellia kenyensis]|uniref:Inverse autotransporter beta domain-containing protein n=1 Tax=Thorsellia kenyensis TaxID=1549888 RepID=A0ABV6C818_9GAMM
MAKIFLKKNRINKLLFILFITTTHIAYANLTNASEQINTSDQQHVINEQMSVYQLALAEEIDVNELIKLNPKLNTNSLLYEGDVVVLPSIAKSIIEMKRSTGQTDETSTILPELMASSNTPPESHNELLEFVPGSHLISGETEENLANVAKFSAEEDWRNYTGKKLTEKIKQQSINKLTSEVNQELTQNAQAFLGKFGKAEISLSIDEKGKLNKPELRLLSPLIDENEHLLFSQIGVHDQDSGKDARTIGNFGLGYRYETPDYITGVNTFIDHDFTGVNTRLGLGAEYWTDSLKFAANTYMPLSNWKESSIMKNHEALIFDERPAKGFDLRAKSYLPDYPQLGGSLMYEQYFGDEVALFGIDKRQKDPYGLSLGVDYMPVPLVKSTVTHKVGKAGQKETKVDLGLQVQLGTPIEEQLNPDNVRLARSLKGSRYDMVDRNYDIVFEYKKEDFSVAISGPDSAVAGSEVMIDSNISSRAAISNYEWLITKRDGQRLPELQKKLNESNSSRLYFYIGNEDVFVRLKVTTDRGHQAISKAHLVKSKMNESQSILEGRFNAEAVKFSDYDFNIPHQIEIINKISDSHKIEMLFTAINDKGEPVDISELNSVELLWKHVGDIEFQSIDKIQDEVKFYTIRDINTPSQLKIYVIADKQFIGDLGGTKSLDFAIISTLGKAVNAQQLLTFTYSDNPLMRIGVDPQNILIELKEYQTEKVISQSGLINGAAFENALENILPNKQYEVKIFSRKDPLNQPDMMREITPLYYDSIVWLYWDPVTQSEVSAIKNKAIVHLDDENRYYRALEGCRGASVFHTQSNNYFFNEIAFNELLALDNQKTERKTKIINEQGLRLAVQFDLTAFNLNGSKKLLCEPPTEAIAPLEYSGYGEDGNKKALLWNEVQ